LVSDNAICGNTVFHHPTALTLETISGTGYLTMIDPTGGTDGNGSVVRINPYNGGSQMVSNYALSIAKFMWGPGGTAYTLGTDGVLFVNGAPFKAQIRDFTITPAGGLYCLGTSGLLQYRTAGSSIWTNLSYNVIAIHAGSGSILSFLSNGGGLYYYDPATGSSPLIASLPNQDVSNYPGWRYCASLVLRFPNALTNGNLSLSTSFSVTAASPATALSQGRQIVFNYEQRLANAGFNVSVASNSDSVVNYTPASRFAVGAPSSVYAGARFSVTVTALDSQGNPTRGFNGTVTLSTSSGSTVAIQVSNGQGSGTLAINEAGTFSASASAGTVRGTSSPISVTYFEYQYTFVVYAWAYGDPDYVVAWTTITFDAQPSQAGVVLNNLEAAWDSHLDVSYNFITSALDGQPIGILV
jgi:hypothetical protein